MERSGSYPCPVFLAALAVRGLSRQVPDSVPLLPPHVPFQAQPFLSLCEWRMFYAESSHTP